MKDKLEPNMYVRIKWGNGLQTISKCTNKVDMGDTQYSNNDFYIHTDIKGEVIYKSMIVKASHNIIDLIEVGDYVNGYYVSKIWKSGEITHYIDEKPIQRKERQITIQAPSYGGIIHLHNEDIKSIVTKEMFSSMEYRLGD